MQIRKFILKKAFKITAEEYFKKTSLNGFGLLYYIRREKYQRVVWFLAILFGCSFAAFVIFLYVSNFVQNPTFIELVSFRQRLDVKPLPAISVCSVNKISSRKLKSFAGKLSNRTNLSQDYWFGKLDLLVGYFEDYIRDIDEGIELELELRKILGKEYIAADILKSLAPTCEESILECYLEGNRYNCSELFELVPTIIGHCCIFNRREEHLQEEKTIQDESYFVNMTGTNMGLTLILNASTSDYFYKSRNMNGFLVHIFDAHTFPDTSTGGVRELFIAPGTDNRVQLLMTSQTVDEEARRFSYVKRRCYFEDEILESNKLANSIEECLGRCRMESSLQLCECVPYYTPTEYLEDYEQNISICSLSDLECLNSFHITWRTYLPQDLSGIELFETEALSCDACYPLCKFNHFNYKKHSIKLEKTLYLRENRQFLPSLLNNTTNVSLVRIYYQYHYITQYNKKVLYNWFHILSNIGGVLGISIGCSIISGFELLYFFVYRFTVNIIRLRKIFHKC